MCLQHATWLECNEIINHSKYILGIGWNQPPVFYNKSCSQKFCNIHWKYLCWSLFLIKNFITKRLLGMSFLVNIAEFYDHLFWRTSANDCFYKMLFWYDPSKAIWPLHKPILLKLLFQKIKKLWISKKYISTILVYVYVMLYKTQHLYNCKGFFFMLQQVYDVIV